MGDLVRYRCFERVQQKIQKQLKDMERNGEILVVISGGIPELLFAPKGSAVNVIDIDNVSDEECHLDKGEDTPEWYMNQIYEL